MTATMDLNTSEGELGPVVSEDGSDDSIFFKGILDEKYLQKLESTPVCHYSMSGITLAT